MTRAAFQTVVPFEPPGPLQDQAAAERRAIFDEQKKSFLRMVSHELRTPLNAVIGFSEILACELYGPLGSPQYREYAEHILASGHKLLTIVNQVLEIARLEGHAADMGLGPEALDHALEDTLEQLSVDLRETGVSIDIGDDTALPSVMADGRGLRTMLFNLLQNAVTWSPAGGVVTVSASPRAGMIDIVIRDSGPGVDPADIPRLLKPFEQGQCPLTRKANGAGLGLPIVEALSGAMGGGLEIISASGEGLTARLSLPAA
ncbi:HAMP domain-containing sensor histidine kinase [Caulobacter sp. NIBR1757]|uniref:sensor histidine kinase n=1 Tax=Caulobacter sp. NIBR1757 TaxID=3016000 RepID=UPI0022F0543E|nr:HAMP domain-containing sensor histidine kinase [Caulobacter sp. NIBR1757]WGM40206.1 Non-motile and phage-resistance protein [Caulobacter sp. NIBR1757]